MKRLLFSFARRFGRNNHILRCKELAAKHPVCVLDIDIAYNTLMYVHGDNGFKGLPPDVRWEFIDRALKVASATNRDPFQTVIELWYATREQQQEMKNADL